MSTLTQSIRFETFSIPFLGALQARAANALRPSRRRSAGLLKWVHLLRRQDGYRPELHYMRGGNTAGAKSLAQGNQTQH